MSAATEVIIVDFVELRLCGLFGVLITDLSFSFDISVACGRLR